MLLLFFNQQGAVLPLAAVVSSLRAVKFMNKISSFLLPRMIILSSLLFCSKGYSEEKSPAYMNVNSVGEMQSESSLHNHLLDQENYDNSKAFVGKKAIIDSGDILNLCEKSILCVVDGKAYLRPDKLLVYNGHYVLLNDLQQLVRLDEVFEDEFGYYIAVKAILCKEGHTAFKKVWGTWYCLVEDCEFYYLKYFDY